MRERIDSLISQIELQRQSYRKLLKRGEKSRKRERDTFLTEKDRTILIGSFVAGGLLENLITKAINRLF